MDAVGEIKRPDGWMDADSSISGYNSQLGIEPCGTRWATNNEEYHKWISSLGGKATGEKIKAGLITSSKFLGLCISLSISNIHPNVADILKFIAENPAGSPWRQKVAADQKVRAMENYL